MLSVIIDEWNRSSNARGFIPSSPRILLVVKRTLIVIIVVAQKVELLVWVQISVSREIMLLNALYT